MLSLLIREAVSDDVLDFVREHLPSRFVNEASVAGPFEVTQAIPVYTVELEDLFGKSFLGAAVFSGWQYIVMKGEEPEAVAEVIVEARDPVRYAEVALSDRAGARKLAEAILSAAVASEIGSLPYEVRILNVPAGLLYAIWLRPMEAGSDLLVPVDRSPSSLEENVVYPEAMVADAVRAVARQRANGSNEEPAEKFSVSRGAGTT